MIAFGTLNWEGFPALLSREQRVNILNEFQYVVPLCLIALSVLFQINTGKLTLPERGAATGTISCSGS